MKRRKITPRFAYGNYNHPNMDNRKGGEREAARILMDGIDIEFMKRKWEENTIYMIHLA